MKKILLKIGIVVVAIAVIVLLVMLVMGKKQNPKNPVATIVIDGYDKPIKIELDPQSAPNAVANFIKLANSGFYTDYKMSIDTNRLLGKESNEMAKLSQIKENPEKDYTYGIKGDFIKNEVENYIKHEKGVITMERNDFTFFGLTKEGYDSANCNFALLTEDMPEYNGYYAAFGKVVEGMDVLDAIAASRVEDTKVDEASAENEQQDNNEDENKNIITIKSITVDTFGVDYGMPEITNYEENYERVQQIYSQYFSGN